jgi:hypothetical protein
MCSPGLYSSAPKRAQFETHSYVLAKLLEVLLVSNPGFSTSLVRGKISIKKLTDSFLHLHDAHIPLVLVEGLENLKSFLVFVAVG